MSNMEKTTDQRLDERLIRIEAHIESLERSINQASGGLKVLIWMGSVAAALATFVATFWHMVSDHR